MNKFVITHRRSGSVDKAAAREAFQSAVRSIGASDARLAPRSNRRSFATFEAEDHVSHPKGHGLIVEKLVTRHHEPVLGSRAPGGNTPTSPPLAQTSSTVAMQVKVVAHTSADPLAGVQVTLVLAPPTVLTGTTGAGGACDFTYTSDLAPGSLSTSPIAGFWAVADTAPTPISQLGLPALEVKGPLGWWHAAVGVTRYSGNRGKGIRIGVVDTGVGPNASLPNVTLVGSLIGGALDPNGGADVDYHGTMVAGLIGARARGEGQMSGVAPGAHIYAIRVFPPEGGSNQADVAAAIDRLVDAEKVDLINLSLTGTMPSDLERDAIRYAYEHGVLCVCAAGNNAGDICFPASYPEAVAVSALGMQGWGPPPSIAAQMVPASPDQLAPNGLFLAPFSSRGAGLTCSAPGLGIQTTFPALPPARTAWGEDSGTSLATPIVVGVLASLLSESAEYRRAPRTSARADLARKLLLEACRSIGIAQEFQGNGVPQVRGATPATAR